MGRFQGLTASLLLDLTYLTSIHDDAAAKLGARRHEKKHRNAASVGHEPSSAGDKADGEGCGEQKDGAASELRVSHSLEEVKAHLAPNSKSECEILSVSGGNEALFSSTPNTAAETGRKKGHEHGARGHEASSISTQSEIHAVQLSHLYLGAMKTLSALLSCSKYAELLLIPKVRIQFLIPGGSPPSFPADSAGRNISSCFTAPVELASKIKTTYF